jgi:hypothetical protein
MNINRHEIDRMFRDIQQEFARHGPIRIPVETERAEGDYAPGTTIYNGPVFQGDVNGNAQLAWGNNTVSQEQHVEQIASGFEPVAEAVAALLAQLPAFGLSPDDQEDAKS